MQNIGRKIQCTQCLYYFHKSSLKRHCKRKHKKLQNKNNLFEKQTKVQECEGKSLASMESKVKQIKNKQTNTNQPTEQINNLPPFLFCSFANKTL